MELQRPEPIITENGLMEYFVDHILDKHPQGCGKQYLVHWFGYGLESDLWLPHSKLLNMEALALWDKKSEE
jgi:hypothetical protein